jgi:signal transduction histidine kinase
VTIRQLIDWFIPEPVRTQDREAVRRARLIVVSSLIAAIMLSSGCGNVLLYGPHAVGPGWLPTTALTLAVPFLLRFTGSIALCGNLFAATVFGYVAFANASTGGCLGSLLCSCVIPFVGVMLCGRRAGVVWGVLAVAQLWFAFGGESATTLAAFARMFASAELELANLISGSLVILITLTLALCHDASFSDALRQVQAADRAKSEFLACMSHEMRTPVSVSLGMSDMLLDEPLEPAQRELAMKLRASSMTLLALLDGILDLSRVEARRIELKRVPLTLEKLVEAAADELTSEARRKGILLEWRVISQNCGELLGDPQRLRQILRNLLANAIEFTSAGRVMVEATVETLEEGRAAVRFAVSDTGPGIPPADLPRLFERYATSHEKPERRLGGAGLGLAISSELVGLMGGKLEVASTLGEGTRFWFRIALPRERKVVRAA